MSKELTDLPCKYVTKISVIDVLKSEGYSCMQKQEQTMISISKRNEKVRAQGS